MKTSKDKNSELRKLASYFTKIEKLATDMGVDMDDLMNEFKNNNIAEYSRYKDAILAKAGERAKAFKNAKGGSEEEWVEKK